MKFEFQIFTEITEELQQEWINLEKKSDCFFFQNLSWINNCKKNYLEKNSSLEMKIILIKSNKESICLLPFQIVKKFGLRILVWAFQDYSDYNVPLTNKNFKISKDEFLNLWKKILKEISNIDFVFLNKQKLFAKKITNPFVEYLDNKINSNIYKISLNKPWEEYINFSINKKLVKDILRQKKNLEKMGNLKFVLIEDEKKKNEIIEFLISNKIKSLTKKSTNINSPMLKDAFYKGLEGEKHSNFQTHFSCLMLNDKILAAHWGIVDKGIFFYLLPANNNEDFFKKYAPGKILLYLLIKNCFENKLDFFDFGYGEENYKTRWSDYNDKLFVYFKFIKFKGGLYSFYLILKNNLKKINFIKNIYYKLIKN
tara:strand:+ start:925 stop:2031 length:1107 start_codon:yes stop_codon:yes gene_type:complete